MTVLAGVLGFPVAHSRSPAMMNEAFGELGLDWRYVKLPVPPELFSETARALPASGYAGANVTIPHKLAALELAHERSEAAAVIGAANTLSFNEGTIAADNTDAGGLLTVLGGSQSGVEALVLGAGGAARAAAWALREQGAAVSVWNRSRQRARALAAELEVEHAERPTAAGLLVNATSVGLEGETEAELLDALPIGGLEPATVVDMPYGSEPTALSRWAAGRGARVVDGLELLVHQGALAFERWTGREAPVDAMRRGAGKAGV